MEAFCRGCLSKFDPVELIQYNEKNRRLFVYSTGLQVKRNDSFPFQLCKDCSINMKMACNFKKNCRNSDKRLRSYLGLKESGECIDFATFLKNNDDALKIRLPINLGNSTPANNKIRDDDNESTCTSIQNFMTDILQEDEIPDSEARIIREVIEEEADISEDSLDSHWLQDEVSMDSDFRLDFSFSPFSAPGSVNNDNEPDDIPKKSTNQEEDKETEKDNDVIVIDNDDDDDVVENNVEDNIEPFPSKDNIEPTFSTKPVYNLTESHFENEFSFNLDPDDKKCTIDVNLENALKNDTADKVMLDDILTTPPMIPNISEPPTPLITNILFGDSIDIDMETTQKVMNLIDEPVKTIENVTINEPIKHIENSQQDIDIIDELLKVGDIKENNEGIDFDNSLIGIQEVEDVDEFFNEPLSKSDDKESKKLIKAPLSNKSAKKAVKRPESPVENKYCINNFYCKMCNRKFKNLVALKVHCTKHHNIKIEKPDTKRIRKKYVCDYCGQIFMSSRCIAKHLENHQNQKTYECPKCKITFTTAVRLKLHESSHTGVRVRSSSKNKSYVCSICGAESTSGSNHNIHMKRHFNEFTVTCDECGKGFYRNYDLIVHQRKHTGERPFKCHYCPSSFTRLDTLTNHVKLHTDERPFTCQFCDVKFCKPYDLKFHQNNSKMCFQKQMQIAMKEQKRVLDEIIVTKAFVY